MENSESTEMRVQIVTRELEGSHIRETEAIPISSSTVSDQTPTATQAHRDVVTHHASQHQQHSPSRQAAPALNLTNQVALILGATGMVGTGAVAQFLEAGARVVVVARTEDKLKELLNTFAPRKAQLIGVVGEFETKVQVEEIRSVIRAALNGETVDHVVSSIGFVNLTPDGISTADINALKKCLDDSLYPTILCAQVFLQDLKDKPGSTYTIVSGGFAHRCYSPNSWVGTVKNAAMNGVIASLASDTEEASVRVNGNCFHYGIGMPWEEKNQLGNDAETSNVEFAKTFLRIIERKDIKGQIICQESKEDTERFLGQSLMTSGLNRSGPLQT